MDGRSLNLINIVAEIEILFLILILPLCSGLTIISTFIYAIMLFLCFFCIFTSHYRINLGEMGVIISITLILYYIFLCIYGYITSDVSDISSISRIIQIICCLSVYYIAKNMKVTGKILKEVRCLILFICLAILYSTIVSYRYNMDNLFFNKNNNYLGMLCFCLIILNNISVAKKNFPHYLVQLFLVIMVFMSGSRSSMIGIFLTIILYKFFLSHHKNFSFGRFLFYSVIVVNLIFIIVYIALPTLDIGSAVNIKSLEMTNKSLFSGRQAIWGQVLNKIYNAPFLGSGLSCSVADLYYTPLSAHNWYLQTLLQTGTIGLIFLITLILHIFKRIFYFMRYSPACLGGAFLLAFITQQSFEIAFTQNHLSVGLIVWFILGLLSNETFYKFHHSLLLNGNNISENFTYEFNKT